MKMEFEFERNPGIELERLARKIKEDAGQATARLAVSAGKQLANKSRPWGLGPDARKEIEENVKDSAARVCYVVKERALLTKLKKGGRKARLKYKGGFGEWHQVQPGQIMADPAQISRQIDKVRSGKTNPPRWIPWDQMVVCSKAAFNNTIRARRKRVGMNKGGWLGAGLAAANFQKGQGKATIGKNVASWAQKHIDQGGARWDGEKKYITLVNNTRNATQLLPDSSVQAAMEKAWEDTAAWYKKAIRRMEKGKAI